MWPLNGSSHCAGSLLDLWRNAGMPCTFADFDSTGYCRRLETKHAHKMLNKPEVMISPSRWMHAQVQKATFMAHKKSFHVTNCIDLDVFLPAKDKQAAKKAVGLPRGKTILLFVSSWGNSPVKGFDLLHEALSKLPESAKKNYAIAVLGGHTGEPEIHGMKAHYLGNKSGDNELARVYQAADVFLCPSREDNYPNTVVEASACGIPTVAFDVGGLPDLIEHGKSGMLAQPYEVDEFAACVIDTLRNHEKMGAAARNRTLENNGAEDHARFLLELYKSCLPGG